MHKHQCQKLQLVRLQFMVRDGWLVRGERYSSAVRLTLQTQQQVFFLS
jgi:hypothetical protein